MTDRREIGRIWEETVEDTEIIELYWQRSETAIKETDGKYGSYCKSIIHNILQNREDTEECINDTWLHTWNSIPTERPYEFRTWLGRIARNLAFDRYRRRTAKKRGGREMDVLLSELEDCLPSIQTVEKELEDAELANLINDFLKKQKKENRMIFVGRYYYSDSVKQIAERYGISESKVKSSLFRTRNGLKTHLEKEGILI